MKKSHICMLILSLCLNFGLVISVVLLTSDHQGQWLWQRVNQWFHASLRTKERKEMYIKRIREKVVAVAAAIAAAMVKVVVMVMVLLNVVVKVKSCFSCSKCCSSCYCRRDCKYICSKNCNSFPSCNTSMCVVVAVFYVVVAVVYVVLILISCCCNIN